MTFTILRVLTHSELGMFHAYRRDGREGSKQRAVNFDWDVVDRVFPSAKDTDTIQINCLDQRRRGSRVPLRGGGNRATLQEGAGVRHGATGDRWRGRLPPPGKHWVHSPAKLDELDRQGRIYWSKNGNPRRKLYLDESPGIYRSNLWPDFRDTQNQNARVTGYPTEKNNEMMKLIVEASSNPGDLVLDCYAGSGTTLMAAGVLGRRWIGIDKSPTAIQVAVERLTKGTPRMGSYARKSYINRDSDSTPVHADLSFRLYAEAGADLPAPPESSDQALGHREVEPVLGAVLPAPASSSDSMPEAAAG